MGTAETRAPPAYLSATYGFSLVRIVAASVSGIPVVSAVSLRAQRLLLFWRYMYLQVMRNCMVGRSFVSPLIRKSFRFNACDETLLFFAASEDHARGHARCGRCFRADRAEARVSLASRQCRAQQTSTATSAGHR